LALFLGFPITGWIASAAGWKSVFIWWTLPVALIAFALSFFVLPSGSIQKLTTPKTSYAGAFKKVLLNRSAVACILATLCSFVSAQVNVYVPTFTRVHFSVDLPTVGYIGVVGAGLAASGAIIGGRLVNPIRRKPLIVVTSLLAGLGTMSFLFMPTLWSNLTVGLPRALVMGMASAALLTLTLEQVPEARGTMMSLNNSFGVVLGAVLGTAIGGFLLNISGDNYQLLGLTLGAIGAAGAAIVLFLTKEPSKMVPENRPQRDPSMV
jgi:predicted MFS family arabinose efflux permease